tara:strand:+ start:1014 stop:1199 length:186 start_codon:yes stop_codon:yes gene_type:complete
MSDFFEVDEKHKKIKILNLDEFSIEDLNNYIEELNKEILRVKSELQKKNNVRKEAEDFFKN